MYAKFHDMTASGACGVSTIPEVMLSFSPGELSTFAGPPTDPQISSRRPFNPADLPCPPRSVMVYLIYADQSKITWLKTLQEENWYMPQSGVPYRPIVAVPQKITDLNPFFAICTNEFLTAIDPPRALVAGLDLLPKSTIAHIQASTTPLMPSRTSENDPAQLGSTSHITSEPKPVQIPKPSQPQPTANPVPNSAGSGGGSPNVANSNDKIFPSTSEDDPPHKPNPNHLSGSSEKENSKQGPDQSDPDQNTTGGDLKPGVDPKQSLSGATQLPDNKADAHGSSIPVIIDADPETVLNTRPSPQGTINRDPNGVAASNPNTDGYSSTTPGQAAAAQVLSGPTDADHASDTDSSGQDAEAMQGEVFAIGNQGPGEAATINGFVAKPVSRNAISVAGKVLTPGAAPITVSQMKISLGPSAIMVGSSSVPIALPSDPVRSPGQIAGIDDHLIQSTMPSSTELSQQSRVTVAGQVYTPAPTGFSIAGTSLMVGHAVTISGTIVSLDASSHLRVGSSTINIGGPVVSVSPQVFTVAGEAVTANPTAVDIAGVTLIPGGHGVTVGGTGILLNSDGDLVVSSKTLSVETSTANLGGLIIEGFNLTRLSGTGSTSSVRGIQPFEGSARALKSPMSWLSVTLLMSATLLLQNLAYRI